MAQEISLIQSVLYVAILAGLGFALITGVLYTLAVQMNHAIAVHELMRQTRMMRAEYANRQRSRNQGDTAQAMGEEEDDGQIYVAQPFDQQKAA